MKIIKHYFELARRNNNNRIDYIHYRVGNIKHELWLKSRKDKNNVYIDSYDDYILENMQFGNTGIYGSAGYYLEDLIKNLTVFENKKIVKTFYPKAIIVKERKEIGEQFPNYFDNFIVTNHREDLWVSRQKLIDTHIKDYKTAMKNGCLFFYTIRDTQITPWNRLKENHYNYFLKLAKDIESQLGFKCLHSTIDFANGDGNENPDTTNGNIKFLFKCIK
jgi:hypothetical protein